MKLADELRWFATKMREDEDECRIALLAMANRVEALEAVSDPTKPAARDVLEGKPTEGG